jgi:hypothetical protein
LPDTKAQTRCKWAVHAGFNTIKPVTAALVTTASFSAVSRHALHGCMACGGLPAGSLRDRNNRSKSGTTPQKSIDDVLVSTGRFHHNLTAHCKVYKNTWSK